jgi:hypothetical protein
MPCCTSGGSSMPRAVLPSPPVALMAMRDRVWFALAAQKAARQCLRCRQAGRTWAVVLRQSAKSGFCRA